MRGLIVVAVVVGDGSGNGVVVAVVSDGDADGDGSGDGRRRLGGMPEGFGVEAVPGFLVGKGAFLGAQQALAQDML